MHQLKKSDLISIHAYVWEKQKYRHVAKFLSHLWMLSGNL